MSIKVVHTSDLHLGMTFKSLGDASKLHRNNCQDTFSKIVDVCIQEKVNALLIAGDFFDSPNPAKSLVRFVEKEFNRLQNENIPVFISTGNHDPYTKGSIWMEYDFPPNVIIFDNSRLEAKTINGITVYGVAYVDDSIRPLSNFSACQDDNFKIGLVHGSTVNINWDEQPEAGYRPISKSDIENSGLDYIALGHFHDLLNLNTKVPCFYSGSPEGLSFKNEGDRYILIISNENNEVKISQRKINKKNFKTLEIDCTSLDNDAEIRKVVSQHSGKNCIFRLVLKGSPSLDFNTDASLLLKEFESDFFFIKIVDKVHIPDDLTEDDTIRGKFIKLMKKEIDIEEDENRKKRLENALRIGVCHLDKKM